jgi:hypothetical protein
VKFFCDFFETCARKSFGAGFLGNYRVAWNFHGRWSRIFDFVGDRNHQVHQCVLQLVVTLAEESVVVIDAVLNLSGEA